MVYSTSRRCASSLAVTKDVLAGHCEALFSWCRRVGWKPVEMSISDTTPPSAGCLIAEALSRVVARVQMSSLCPLHQNGGLSWEVLTNLLGVASSDGVCEVATLLLQAHALIADERVVAYSHNVSQCRCRESGRLPYRRCRRRRRCSPCRTCSTTKSSCRCFFSLMVWK